MPPFIFKGMLTLGLTLGFSLGSSLFVGGSSAHAKSEHLFCPIIRLKPASEGLQALIHCGKVDGLSDQSQVQSLFQRYEKGVRHGKAYTLPQLRLDPVGELYSEVQIPRLPEGDETLQVGDLVTVSVEVPDIAASQTLFRLSLLHVIFQQQTMTPNPWVQYRDYLRQPTYDFQTTRLVSMLIEIYETAAFADEVAGTDPMVGGRFEGLTLKEAMLKSSTADLADFFAFVEAFPGKYIGYTWKLPEVYATWILNKTPGPDDPNVEKNHEEK